MPALTNLDVIALVDSFPYPHDASAYSASLAHLYKFMSHDLKGNLGYVLASTIEKLRVYHPEKLVIDDLDQTISIAPAFDTFEKRTKMMADLALEWRKEGKFEVLKGWREEQYAVYYPSRELYFTFERSACSVLGLVTYGVHIIGYIPATDTAPLRLWVPRRSKTKSTYPGMLDNTVAGGIGYPYGVFDTLIKECGEEAGFDAQLIKERAKSVGSVSYHYLRTAAAGGESGFLQPEVQYTYDLELDESSPKPKPVDGEVEEFYLWDVDTVRQEIAAGNFKPNTALVTIDFLIRHGIITAENEPDFLEIVSRMHRQIEHPLK
ncbi:NUDIX hydrolase domain-like protein [Myxozyma melibiosi]|uniref:NUDIX hydrolase domain-like protein n=1 Tax=Myxozyma melibiosi TaxID=54550 RepID=A0ABR1FCJ1_9ASCO